jgi:hypothetical protein
MAKSRKHKVDLAGLAEDMNKCRLSLRFPRSERREMVRQLAGRHYSEEGTVEKVPVNLISLYYSIVGRTLIPKDPRGMFATYDQEAKAIVQGEEAWCNKQVVRMHLAETIQRVVEDALFSVGILKVGLATPADASQLSWNLPAGQPFALPISLDDFVFDVHARKFAECAFMGHRYRVPLDSVRDSPLYSKARKELTPSNDEPFNREGDERTNIISRGWYSQGPEKFDPHVDLWEIYIPRKRLIITLADDFDDDEYGEPLRQQEWIGPDCGPYHILGYQWLPDQAMPKGPIQDLYDLHMFINSTYRKLMRQADRQKENVFVSAGATEDGTRVMKSNDGEILRVDQPDKIHVVTTNQGPNQANLLFWQNAYETFSKQAGNLEMMGGLSPQSKTATQDKMLQANASGQITSMQYDTTNFVEAVFRSLCWYFHHHPVQVMKTKRPLPGLPDMDITQTVTPQDRRQVRFDDMDISIDIYSMQPRTPQSVLQGIQQTLGTIQPFMALAQQQGVGLDMNALFASLAKFMDLPEMMDFLQIQQPPQPEGSTPGQPGADASKPAETTRNYVRRSMGGDSSQGSQQNDMMNSMMKAVGRNGSMPVNPNGVAQ